MSFFVQGLTLLVAYFSQAPAVYCLIFFLFFLYLVLWVVFWYVFLGRIVHPFFSNYLGPRLRCLFNLYEDEENEFIYDPWSSKRSFRLELLATVRTIVSIMSFWSFLDSEVRRLFFSGRNRFLMRMIFRYSVKIERFLAFYACKISEKCISILQEVIIFLEENSVIYRPYYRRQGRLTRIAMRRPRFFLLFSFLKRIFFCLLFLCVLSSYYLSYFLERLDFFFCRILFLCFSLVVFFWARGIYVCRYVCIIFKKIVRKVCRNYWRKKPFLVLNEI